LGRSHLQRLVPGDERGLALTSPYSSPPRSPSYAQWSLNTTAPPTVTVIYPVSGSVYGTNWSGAITGSASAKGGKTISLVKVAIENTTTGKVVERYLL